MEGNSASSYVSHGINLTVTLLALRAAAVYNQTLETLSSLIFLKTSPRTEARGVEALRDAPWHRRLPHAAPGGSAGPRPRAA